jgi:DNA-binding MarR family transcriptional regulator
MNEQLAELNQELLKYQTQRFQDLMEETLECCQARTSYLSRKFDLPQAELRCLMLFLGERYLTVKSIAQRLDVAKSRVTKIIDGLMKKKLVERIEDPRDGRVRLITLTPEGQRKSKEIGSLITDLHQMILLELLPEERKVVLSSLEMLRTSMEAIKKLLV